MENTRGRVVQSGTATSPESAMASELFDQFVSAGTFKSVLSTYRQLCDVLRLKPTNISSFYPRLKAKLHSWRAASLWAKLDKRASHKCYNRGKACPNTRVLLIGAGPCGLRAAIEAQLLGAKVVVVEKRDRFSRNNVLHLWPFVIHDLRNLGAKKFFGKFCAGSIDHISIRQLQLILLKVALLLGVEVHENVGFVSLLEPPEDQSQERIGWRACVDPADHPVSQYEFDVLIGADGKRNTLLGFNRKEFRGKLAIAITANFINKHTLEEARVPEISGVAFIFNQKFFQDMREQTGIDLENIVYYKDDTHYFVMTAKKQSLLDRGVIISDYNDTARLLSAENVDREALMEYARDAANFATNYQLPNCDFAVNHYRQADVAMFDFTSMYAAENASRITERRGHKLLQGLVGDSLLEPFWPTGSGCARGFLSSFDAGWMIRSWASGKVTPLQVLAEREAIYRLLAQTTPENLSKDLNQYTLNPSSRYPNLNLHAVLPSQVRMLYSTDGKIEDQMVDAPVEIPKKKRRRESIIHPDALLNWCQKQVALQNNIKIENLTSSWKNGLALCAILHRYRPDLIDISSLKPEDAAKNNQLAFDICEKELGIPPVMTGQEMADCEVPDKLSMVSYLAQIYETFRGEIPVVCRPKSSIDDRAISPNRQSFGTPLAILTKLSNKLQNKRKYSLEKEGSKEKGDSLKRGRHPPLIHKRRSKEKDKGIALDLVCKDVELTNFKMQISSAPKESIDSRVKNLEMIMRRDAGLRCHLIEGTEDSKYMPSSRAEHSELNIKLIQEQLKKNGSETKEKKPSGTKVGRLRKDEWNVKMLEEKISQQQKSLQKTTDVERPKILQDIFDDKLRLIEAKARSGGALTVEEEARFKKFDSSLSKLNEHLIKGNLEAGERGHNQVAAMTEHMSTIWDKKTSCRKDPLPPAPIIGNVPKSESVAQIGGSEVCYFCKKRVFVVERLSAEGLFFHHSCFKCEYCNTSLRLGNYSFDRDTVCGGKFYCHPHFRMQKPDPRSQEMMKRKEAFLSCACDEQTEKIYKTLLANAEKALSPNKQRTVDSKLEPSVTDSPGTAFVSSLSDNSVSVVSQELKSPSLLSEPMNNFARDQTPERVEYENIILDYSEEELLTTELEEEELTQKNLGPSQELTTSEDEYSDFSTDSESDEEAYAEELERSLTADETRKLAERWQKKYSTEQSLIDSCASSSVDDDVSDTEVGSEDGTSDDINSDEEYSVDENKDAEHDNEKNKVKSSETKDNFTVEVPIIDLKGLKQLSEEESPSTESDISEELSDSEKGSHSKTTESDVDTESEPELLLPPPQIPTIIIEEFEESCSQYVDHIQEWTENVMEKLTGEKTSNPVTVVFSPSIPDIDSNIPVSNIAEEKHANVAQAPYVETQTDEIIECANLLSKKTDSDMSLVPVSVCDSVCHEIGPNADNLMFSNETAVSSVCAKELDISSNIVHEIAAMEHETAQQIDSTKENLSKCIKNEQIHSERDQVEKQNIMILNDTEIYVPASESASFHIPTSLPLLSSGILVQNVCMEPSPCTCDSSSVSSSGGWGILKSEKSSEDSDFPLLDPENSPLDPEKQLLNTDISHLSNIQNASDKKESFESKGEIETPLKEISASKGNNIISKLGDTFNALSNSRNLELENNISPVKYSDNDSQESFATLNSSDFKNNSKLHLSYVSSDTDIESENYHYNPAFVTIRQKRENHNDSYNWDSDKSITLPWFSEEIDDFSIELAKIELLDSKVDWSVKTSNQNDPVITSDNTPYETAKGSCSDLSLSELKNNLENRTSPVEYRLDQKIQNTQNSVFFPISEYSVPSEPKLESTPIKQISEIITDSKITKEENLGSDSAEIKKPSSWVNSLNTKHQTYNKSPLSELDDNESRKNQKIKIDNFSEIQHEKKNLSADQISPLDGQDSSVSSNSGKDSKYRGYSGSFAEKIRPKSALGDTIYLRSLDINLQKQQFPSLAKSNDKLDEVNCADEYQVKKKLFHSTEKLQNHHVITTQNDSLLGSYKKNFKRQISMPSDCQKSNVSKTVEFPPLTPPANLCSKNCITTVNNMFTSFDNSQKSNISDQNCTALFHESYGDPVSPYTYSQTKAAKENVFPVKMRPKCDMDLSKLQEKREKRKSVHENIQGLPFADEEKAITPIDTPTTPGSLSNPLGVGTECMFSDSAIVENSSAQEKARKEARARARLKSDEELGLSPKNYRKKYQRQLSLSSIYYDELVGDEFYDHENEVLEDEIIDGTFHAKRVEISELNSEGSDCDQQVLDKGLAMSNSTPLSKLAEEKLSVGKIPHENIVKELKPDEHNQSETVVFNMKDKYPLDAKSSVHLAKNNSEINPNIDTSESTLHQTKCKIAQCSENSGEEEKLKSSGKKSFFSILNFGKGHMAKEKSSKNKTKNSENVRASSLPTDLYGKTPPKQKTVANLKLNKSKERTKEKLKQKHTLVENSDTVTNPDNNVKIASDQPSVEPRSILLNAEQAKIVPKYTVYRNPGSRLTAIPDHVPTQKTENGLAPKASEDSFSDTEDDTQKFKLRNSSTDLEKDEKDLSEKEKKAQRVIQKVQRQQELKRLRTAQEIQRRLEELEIQQKELEQQGVEVEKALRQEGQDLQHRGESDLMQEWYKFIHSKNRLLREEQELLIRLKELELEDRHSHLQQEMRERMAQVSQKNPNQIGEEKKILTEMLRIVEERDELVAMLEQLRLKEEEEDDKHLGSQILSTTGLQCSSKS